MEKIFHSLTVYSSLYWYIQRYVKNNIPLSSNIFQCSLYWRYIPVSIGTSNVALGIVNTTGWLWRKKHVKKSYVKQWLCDTYHELHARHVKIICVHSVRLGNCQQVADLSTQSANDVWERQDLSTQCKLCLEMVRSVNTQCKWCLGMARCTNTLCKWCLGMARRTKTQCKWCLEIARLVNTVHPLKSESMDNPPPKN